MAWYYHYTDERSLQLIKQSRKIKASTDTVKDCLFGKGVYFTKIAPENYSREFIAKNNYDGAWRRGINEGKCDFFIKVYIPGGKIRRVSTGTNRDIYLYEGNVHLNDFAWESGKVPTRVAQVRGDGGGDGGGLGRLLAAGAVGVIGGVIGVGVICGVALCHFLP